MKNKYNILGNVTEIILKRKNGENLITQIDTDDLPKAQKMHVSWYAHWTPSTKSFYCECHTKNISGKQITVSLARLLMGCPNNLQVDHINHDTLDNRRSNLRIVTRQQNMQNIGVCRNSKSGVRGVCFHKANKKWKVQVQVNGKQEYFGLYDTIAEAESVAVEVRRKHMPYSEMDFR